MSSAAVYTYTRPPTPPYYYQTWGDGWHPLTEEEALKAAARGPPPSADCIYTPSAPLDLKPTIFPTTDMPPPPPPLSPLLVDRPVKRRRKMSISNLTLSDDEQDKAFQALSQLPLASQQNSLAVHEEPLVPLQKDSPITYHPSSMVSATGGAPFVVPQRQAFGGPTGHDVHGGNLPKSRYPTPPYLPPSYRALSAAATATTNPIHPSPPQLPYPQTMSLPVQPYYQPFRTNYAPGPPPASYCLTCGGRLSVSNVAGQLRTRCLDCEARLSGNAASSGPASTAATYPTNPAYGDHRDPWGAFTTNGHQ